MQRRSEQWISFFQKTQEKCVVDHPGAIIGGFWALVCNFLFTFGLFKMLVVALFVLVGGVAIGGFLTERQPFCKIRSLFTDRN